MATARGFITDGRDVQLFIVCTLDTSSVNKDCHGQSVFCDSTVFNTKSDF